MTPQQQLQARLDELQATYNFDPRRRQGQVRGLPDEIRTAYAEFAELLKTAKRNGWNVEVKRDLSQLLPQKPVAPIHTDDEGNRLVTRGDIGAQLVGIQGGYRRVLDLLTEHHRDEDRSKGVVTVYYRYSDVLRAEKQLGYTAVAKKAAKAPLNGVALARRPDITEEEKKRIYKRGTPAARKVLFERFPDYKPITSGPPKREPCPKCGTSRQVSCACPRCGDGYVEDPRLMDYR
jgi:hypothetical protein